MRPAVKRSLLVVLALVAIIGGRYGYLIWKYRPQVPDRPFAKPTGSYPIGTREFSWIDSTRGEAYTKDPNDKRWVLVQVWYPAAPGAAGDTARYLLRPDEFADAKGAKAARNARTNAVFEAPAASAPDSAGFPVLIYNHGGLWTRWSATFAAEELASHGYVVVSVEHFGFNQTVKLPNGTPYTPDTLAFPKETEDKKASALASWAYLENPVFGFWKADAQAALDRLPEWNRSGPFQGRLDLGRIGAYGWSFGGALALELAAVDPRVKAAVDHDGQLFGEVKDKGTNRPVLQFHHGRDDALDYPEADRPAVHEMMALVDRQDSVARARSTNDWYSVTVAGTSHGDFSDLALFYPRADGMTPPRTAHRVITGYTVAFFDQYLKGQASPLLAPGAAPADPVVTIQAWRRPPADSAARR